MVSEVVLDLRGIAVWDRAEQALARADCLEPGSAFEFLTEINPRALINRLEQLRPHAFTFRQRRVAETMWSITLARMTPGASSPLDAVFYRNAALASLSGAAQLRLRDALELHTSRKGHCVCEANEPRDHFGVMLDGSLGIMGGSGSRERLLFHIFEGELFGEVELLDGGHSLGRTIVLSKTATYAMVRASLVKDLLNEEPAFLAELALQAAQHTRTLAEALSAQIQQPTLSRVASALLPYAAPERGLHPALPPLAGMTQTQVAAAAGTVKEVAARAIAELERLEALKRERGHIAYLDRVKLLELCDRT